MTTANQKCATVYLWPYFLYVVTEISHPGKFEMKSLLKIHCPLNVSIGYTALHIF